MQFLLAANLAANTLIIAAGIGIVSFVPMAHAQEVKGAINVMICPRGDQSGIALVKPLSDTVVDQPTVKIEGAVQSISLIDFYADDAYNNTIAVGAGEESFASEVFLTPGTHTIKLVAFDSCAQETHETSFVITYHPQIVPSAGNETSTTVNGGTGKAVAARAASEAGNVAPPPEDTVPASKPSVSGFVDTLFGNWGTGGDAGGDSRLTFADIFKPISVIIGIIMTLTLPTFLEKGAMAALAVRFGYIPLRRFFKKQRIRDPRVRWSIRAVGLSLIVAPFLV